MGMNPNDPRVQIGAIWEKLGKDMLKGMDSMSCLPLCFPMGQLQCWKHT